MSKPNIHVAVAILLHRNKVLVGWRQAEQHQGNKYEFPGGKVEQGETPLEACRREVYEEVGVGISSWNDFDFIRHEYDDVIVNLHLFHAAVPDELLNEIQQPWTWYSREELTELNFPSANKSIVSRLAWKHQIRISEQLEVCQQLENDQLLYWRNDVTAESLKQLAELNIEQLPKLIVNMELWKKLNTVQQQSISAVHLKQQQLMALKKGELKAGKRYIAACHDLISMKHAQHIGCDAVLLSPVCRTATHPDAVPLGWSLFKEYAAQVDIPVFALGGISHNDLIQVQQSGGYGIAGISTFN